MFEPGDGPVLVRLLDRDVSHEAVGCRTVPVLLPRLDVDDVPGTNLVHLATATGDQADAVGHVQRLAPGVRVPSGAGTRRESHVGTADGRLVVGVADAVDVDGA